MAGRRGGRDQSLGLAAAWDPDPRVGVASGKSCGRGRDLGPPSRCGRCGERWTSLVAGLSTSFIIGAGRNSAVRPGGSHKTQCAASRFDAGPTLVCLSPTGTNLPPLGARYCDGSHANKNRLSPTEEVLYWLASEWQEELSVRIAEAKFVCYQFLLLEEC